MPSSPSQLISKKRTDARNILNSLMNGRLKQIQATVQSPLVTNSTKASKSYHLSTILPKFVSTIAQPATKISSIAKSLPAAPILSTPLIEKPSNPSVGSSSSDKQTTNATKPKSDSVAVGLMTGEKPFMMTWTENVAKRGSNEILSCLFEFLNNIGPMSHLRTWSDSCAGQNKNFNLIAFYQYLILHKYFDVIDHKFPEVGHSYLDSDRDFGRIEKVLRKHEKICSPEEYRSHIKSALPAKAKVIDMTGKFYDISGLVAGLRLYNNKRNDLNEHVQFRDNIRWIRVEKFGYYLYKDCLDENAPFKRVNIAQSGNEPIDFELEKKPSEPMPIDKMKIDNLKEQLKFIEPQYQSFYKQIFDAASNNNNADGSKDKTQKKKPAGLKRISASSQVEPPKKRIKKVFKKPKQSKQTKWNETNN